MRELKRRNEVVFGYDLAQRFQWLWVTPPILCIFPVCPTDYIIDNLCLDICIVDSYLDICIYLRLISPLRYLRITNDTSPLYKWYTNEPSSSYPSVICNVLSNYFCHISGRCMKITYVYHYLLYSEEYLRSITKTIY